MARLYIYRYLYFSSSSLIFSIFNSFSQLEFSEIWHAYEKLISISNQTYSSPSVEQWIISPVVLRWLQVKCSEVAELCPTLWDPMDYSLPGSSVHGIFQARVLEWVATAFSKRSSRPRDGTQVSRILGRHFTVWATKEANKMTPYHI